LEVEGLEEEEKEEEEGKEEEEEKKEEEEEEEPSPTPKPKVTPPDKPYIEVEDTPTGWLRVRAEASVNSDELAKINPGEMYPYLEEEDNGWYKIEYEDGEEGWVSGDYVKLVE
jgi:hypothetical protein